MAECWLQLGEAYREMADPVRALSAATHAEASMGESGNEWVRRGAAVLRMWAHHGLGNDAAALEAAEALLAEARAGRAEPWLQVDLATHLDLVGRHDEAADLMQEAVDALAERGADTATLDYYEVQAAVCLLGGDREAEAGEKLAGVGAEGWWPGLVAKLLRSGIAAHNGDAQAAKALLAEVGTDTILDPGLGDMLGLDDVNTLGEHARIALLMRYAAAGLEAALADAEVRAAARLVCAEALNSAGRYEEALEEREEAEGLAGELDVPDEVRVRFLKASASTHDGLGDAAKASALRSEAERLLRGEAPGDAVENPAGGPANEEDPFG